jgi:F0F1-type ATP synthase membrane subunit a
MCGPDHTLSIHFIRLLVLLRLNIFVLISRLFLLGTRVFCNIYGKLLLVGLCRQCSDDRNIINVIYGKNC